MEFLCKPCRVRYSQEDLKEEEPEVCFVCLGLLQQDSSLNQKIIAKLNEENYDCKSASIQLSIPANISVRERVASDFFTKKPVKNVKESLKSLLEKNFVLPCWPMGDLKVILDFESVDTELDCAFLAAHATKKMKIKNRKTKHSHISRNQVEHALASLSTDDLAKHFPWPPRKATEKASLASIQFDRDPLLLAGCYVKNNRTTSQSPWFMDGKRFGTGSVSEFIEAVAIKACEAKEARFSSAGREDIDVLMKGNGRPFLLSILNAKKFYSISAGDIENAINASTQDIQVLKVCWVSPLAAKHLKAGEETKEKTYRCIVYSRKELPNLDLINQLDTPFVIQQKTPIRVLHRRANLTRPKSILSIKAEFLSEQELAERSIPKSEQFQYFSLELETQAGTYVKEFVHGDLGRTFPSLSSIMSDFMDILELDVLSVELEWPVHAIINT